MEVVCYPRFPNIYDQYYPPDLKLRFHYNADIDNLSVSVHRQYLSNKSNYFNATFQECPVGQEWCDILDYDENFTKDLIKFHYTDSIKIDSKSIEPLYTHAVKWNEKSLWETCLRYLESKEFENVDFSSFPPKVQLHFYKNVTISIKTIKNLLPLLAKRLLSYTYLQVRIETFMANEVGGFNMHKLWKWCNLNRLAFLAQDMVDYATRLTNDLENEMTIDKLFPIVSLWIYMDNQPMYQAAVKFLRRNAFVIPLNQFKVHIEEWIDSATFTASLAMAIYKELFVYNRAISKLRCLRQKFRQVIKRSAKTVSFYLKVLSNIRIVIVMVKLIYFL